MARFVDISLIGDAELQAALRELVPAVQRKIVRKGLRVAGNIHLKAAKAAAQNYSKGTEGRVDDPFMPKVAKLLKLRSLKRSRKGFGVQIVTPTREELGLPPERKGYPPAHIELGTAKTPALPFMRWAFDQNEPRMTEAIADSVREGIDEVWRRVGVAQSLASAGYGAYTGPVLVGSA